MLSPYWAHRNEANFPDPEKYDPVSTDGGIAVEPVLEC